MKPMTGITLPQGLRIKLINNDGFLIPAGVKGSLAFDEYIDFKSASHNLLVSLDGYRVNTLLPLGQCEIIKDNFKKRISR